MLRQTRNSARRGVEMQTNTTMTEPAENKSPRRLPRLCPVCGSGRTHRSRVGLIERLVVWLRYRPYRCDHCKSRFWKFRW